MILEKIEENPGITFRQLIRLPEISALYDEKTLSREMNRLKRAHKVYVFVTSKSARKLFIWRNDFECQVCGGSLPVTMPSLEDENTCKKCYVYRHRPKLDEKFGGDLSQWLTMAIINMPTQDPRGYYGANL
jgi:hypothetical protein